MDIQFKTGPVSKIIEPIIKIANKGDSSWFDTGKVELAIKEVSEMKTVTISAFVGSFGGFCSLTPENSDISLVVNKGEHGDRLTVNASQLFDSLNSFKENEIIQLNLDENLEPKEESSEAEGTSDESDEGFEKISGHLKISILDDQDEHQSLPVYIRGLEFPETDNKKSNSVSIQKDAFVNALKKIEFAIGEEKSQPAFMHFRLTTSKSKFRLSAGTGARFLVVENEGDKVIKGKKSHQMLFWGKTLYPLGLLLAASTASKVQLKQYLDENGAEAACVFDMGEYGFMSLGVAEDIYSGWKVVDEDSQILQQEISHEFVVDPETLLLAVKGVQATNNKQIQLEKQIHKATLVLDKDAKTIVLSSDHHSKCKRKAKCLDAKFHVEDKYEGTFASAYFGELVSKLKTKGNFKMSCLKDKSILIVQPNAGDTVDVEATQYDLGIKATERVWMFFVQCTKG